MRLEKCLLNFDAQVAYSGCKLVQRDALGEDKEGILQTKVIGEYNDAFDPQRLYYENYIPLINLLISRELWQRLNGFDPNFDVFEDWDMLLRLSQLTRFYHLNRLTTEYAVWGRQQITQRTAASEWFDAYARMLQKHILSLSPEKQLKLLTHYWIISQERRGIVGQNQRELENLKIDLIRQQETVAHARQQQAQIEHDRSQYQTQIEQWQRETQIARQQIVAIQTQYENLNTQLLQERQRFELQHQAERDHFQQQHQALQKQLQDERQQFELQRQNEQEQFQQQYREWQAQLLKERQGFELEKHKIISTQQKTQSIAEKTHKEQLSDLQEKWLSLHNQYQTLQQHYHVEYQRNETLQSALHEMARRNAVGVSKDTLTKLTITPENAYALATQTGGVIDDYLRLLNWVRERANESLQNTTQLKQMLQMALEQLQTNFQPIDQQLQHLLNLLSASRWPQVRRYVPLAQHIRDLTTQSVTTLRHQLDADLAIKTSHLLTSTLPKELAAFIPEPRPLSILYPTFACVAGSNQTPRFMEVVESLGTTPFALTQENVLVFTTHCHLDNFFRIDILFATYMRINSCQVRLLFVN
ncbi:hypothetical protein TPSD3_10285 [Thioflexithrix psekupsensis]|uniref:Uncharacterized protein n=1 Tax=Thioflexithrix psekupsensis TaxID=1570016 RepID=A0A251X6W1_9GAMM|nr:hypothetical protein TPSD3_10285 [Thioflexithrix psekupsensis]